MQPATAFQCKRSVADFRIKYNELQIVIGQPALLCSEKNFSSIKAVISTFQIAAKIIICILLLYVLRKQWRYFPEITKADLGFVCLII